MIFVNECTQEFFNPGDACSAAPTNVTSNVNYDTLTNVGADFTNHEQMGYLTNGRYVAGQFDVLQSIS